MVAAPVSGSITPTSPVDFVDAPIQSTRPKDVGILAMEMYFPKRVRVLSLIPSRMFSDQSWLRL